MTAENEYDIIIAGAGIAGLWLGARLLREGYNVLVLEETAGGGVQTLASQGMIHGGQKYTLTGASDPAAEAAAKMPERWEAAFGGYGELDLTSVRFTDESQVMWPAGNMIASAAVFAAAKAVNAGTEKLKPADWPEPLAVKSVKGPVYRLPEKVLDVKSLVDALSAPLKGRLLRARAENPRPDGYITANGKLLKAQAVIFAAGKGNEDAFRALKVDPPPTQRRPLRQIMVKTLPFALNGHGIWAHPKPRLTVTSHQVSAGYVWYLGGNVAEKSAELTEEETIAFAKRELEDVFPHIDWTGKEWATWPGDRAEPKSEDGHLPPGPYIHQRGQILFAWPVKLTFAPLLADRVLDWLHARKIAPRHKTPPPDLPPAETGNYPWDIAQWRTPA